MDYNGITNDCGFRAEVLRMHHDDEGFLHELQCKKAIADLLARAEAAEARAEKAEKALRKVQSILYDPLIVEENGVLRPVKRTSRQDVYKTVLLAQKSAGITGRWFPEWMKEE